MLRNNHARIEQWCSATRKEFTEGVRLLLKYWKCSSALRENVILDVLTFLKPATDSDALIKRLKWVCVYPMARLFGEPTEEISQPLRWTGQARRWFRAKLYRCPENAKLWFSWFQLKRCTMTVPEEFILSEARKHREAMARPGGGKLPARLLLELTKMPIPFVEIDEDLAPTVSRSACFETARAAGGAFWYLRTLQPPKSDPRDHLWTVEGLGFVDDGCWKDEFYYRRERCDSALFLHFLRSEALAEEDNPFLPEARVEFVLEPLKVRTITKGPAALYSYARCWQRSFHRRLKQVPGFQLIGRPVENGDISALLAPTNGVLDPDWEFVSIDYKAATDNIDRRLTLAALRRSCRGLSAEEYFLIRKAVMEHNVSYPKRLKIEPVVQRNGQLMGSPVSFPLLCLINASTIRSADADFCWDRWSCGPYALAVRYGIDPRLPFLVNGDDALVYRPKGWRQVHEGYSRAAGLTYSVGKVYAAAQYANINSVGFWIEKSGEVKRLDYIPVGLMRGHHKLTEESFEDDSGVFGALTQTLQSCLERPNLALREFISLNRDTLRKGCRGRNLFICRPEGGLGFQPPPGWKFSISQLQREWAGSCEVGLSRVESYRRPPVVRDSGLGRWVIDHDRWADRPPVSNHSRRRGAPREPHIGQWFLAPSEAGPA